MTWIAALTALISGGLATAVLVGVVQHWITPDLSLTPLWVSQSALFFRIAGIAGGIFAVLLLAGGYQTRRLVVALAAGAALALPLARLIPTESARMAIRPEWTLGLAVCFAFGLWSALAEPAETGGTVGREEATLRAVFWLALGGLGWFAWRAVPGLTAIAGQSVLSGFGAEESGLLRGPLLGCCACGAAILLSWMSWERYLLTAVLAKPTTPFLRNQGDWRR